MRLLSFGLAALLAGACTTTAVSSDPDRDPTDPTGGGSTSSGSNGGGSSGGTGASSGEGGGSSGASGASGSSGSSSGDGGADGAVPDVFATDPLSCGAQGHSCLGRPCDKGRCAVESIHQYGSNDALAWYGFDELHRLVTVSNYVTIPQTSHVRRWSTTTNMMALLFDMTAGKPASPSRDAAFLENRLFIIGNSIVGQRFERWTSSGAGATGTSTILDDAPPPWFAIDADFVFYVRQLELYRADHTGGGKTRLAASTVFPSPRGALDGANVYFLQGDRLARVPKADGPVETFALTGVPSGIRQDLVGVTTTHAAAVAAGPACTGPSVLWSAPKAGGASIVLGHAKIIGATVDGDFAYWIESECYASATRILRRRLDGTDAALVLAEGSYRGQPSSAPVIHGGYVHFAGPAPSNGNDAQAILRVGK